MEFQAQAHSNGEKGTSPPVCLLLGKGRGGEAGRPVQNPSSPSSPPVAHCAPGSSPYLTWHSPAHQLPDPREARPGAQGKAIWKESCRVHVLLPTCAFSIQI